MSTSWKMHRVLVGATQREIAGYSGISCGRLRQIEHGLSEPTKNEQAALLSTFRRLRTGPKTRNRHESE